MLALLPRASSVLNVLRAPLSTDDELVAACQRVKNVEIASAAGDATDTAVLQALVDGGAFEALAAVVQQRATCKTPGSERVAAMALIAMRCLGGADAPPHRVGRVLRAVTAAISAFPASVAILSDACGVLVNAHAMVASAALREAVPEYLLEAALAALSAVYRLQSRRLSLPVRAVDFAACLSEDAGFMLPRPVSVPADALTALLETIAGGIDLSEVGAFVTARQGAPVRTDVVHSAIRNLQYLALLEPRFGLHASRQGAAAAVVHALTMHPASEKVQASGINCLETLASAEGELSALRTLASGAAEAAVAALRARGAEELVAGHACGMLARLSWSTSPAVCEALVARCRACGAAAVLRRTMLRHGGVAYDAAIVLELLLQSPDAAASPQGRSRLSVSFHGGTGRGGSIQPQSIFCANLHRAGETCVFVLQEAAGPVVGRGAATPQANKSEAPPFLARPSPKLKAARAEARSRAGSSAGGVADSPARAPSEDASPVEVRHSLVLSLSPQPSLLFLSASLRTAATYFSRLLSAPCADKSRSARSAVLPSAFICSRRFARSARLAAACPAGGGVIRGPSSWLCEGPFQDGGALRRFSAGLLHCRERPPPPVEG